MLFKFFTGKRPTLSVRANSETEARQKLNLSQNAVCIARYTDAFLAQKQANMTACKEVRYA